MDPGGQWYLCACGGNAPGISLLSWAEGTSVVFMDPADEYFHISSSAVITLLDTSVSGFSWETTDDSVFLLEPDPDNEYRCGVTALKAVTARIMVAGITSPEFTIPDCMTVTHEGAVFTFEEDVELTLVQINQSAARTRIPAIVNGCPVTGIAKGTTSEDSTILVLEIGNGIKRIETDAFPYALHAIQRVTVPESVQVIGSMAFSFDYPVFVDFYFDDMNTIFEDEAIHMDLLKLGDAPVCGVDYRITIHCRAGSSAEAYALRHGWQVVYTDDISLSLTQTSMVLFRDEPFMMYAYVPVELSPEALQDRISLTYTASNNCVLVDEDGILCPNKAGTATVTASYGDVSVTMNVRVIGQSEYSTMPAGVKVIETEAFFGNRDLQAVILPQGIERLEARAFAGCTALKAVWLPASLTYIAPDAFEGCSGLTFYLPDTNAEIALEFVQYYEYPYILYY